MAVETNRRPLIALLTNNDDDVYCFRKELIEGLIAQGYDMLISCPYGEKFELMQHIEYIYDDPVIDRRGTNIVADFKLYCHYKKLFAKCRPDVVLTYTAKPNVYASIAARQLKIPYINNVTGFGSVLNKKGLMRAFIMGLFKFAYRGAHCIMFQNSTNQKLALEQGMVKGDHRLIPGSGVDLTRFPLQSYPNGGNGSQGETVVFNYIGRVLHDKGVDDYIAAAKRIKEKYPNTEFNMIGFIEPTESHYEEDLRILGEQDIVHYRGSQKDVKPFIARAHAIIHPSTYGEGMSNVLLENAASGRFLITTDNPGCRETVVDGQSGYIYPGGNVDALVQKIEAFLAMPNETRKQMGECGRNHVEQNFSRAIVVAAYQEKIKVILQQNDKTVE
jgi:galacturonosyltransferase